MSIRVRSDRLGRRGLAACLVGGALVTCATFGPTSSAAADIGGDPTAPASAAGLTPLLRILDFGAAIGLPLACNLATSVVTAGAAQAHQAMAVSAVVTQILDQCTSLSQAGDGALQNAIAQSKALSLINPVLDPAIAGMATGTHVAGATNATSVAPFGPTIDGLGGTLAFFEGS